MRVGVRLLDDAGRETFTRAIPFGTEDWVRVDGGEPFLEWEVTLDARTAGLRFFASTLELLDADGAPRLRMAPPWALDARHEKVALDVSIRGCAYDASPLPPFYRPVTPPGARTCTIHVAWKAGAIAFPALVDPAWTSTSALTNARYRHTATRLPNGNVLVAGGFVVDPVVVDIETPTTEIFSPTLGAWAVGAPMGTPRAIAAAAPLASGDVLVVGGLTDVGSTVLGTAEIYSVASGTWMATGALSVPRSGHTASAIGDGTVLVAAGYDNSGVHWTTAERFSNGSFVAAGDINTTRFFHSAVVLPDKRVLIGGGTDPENGPLASLELYTPGVGWASAASLAQMTTARTLATAALLPDGDVLFVGGYGGVELASAERYRPSTNTWTTVPAAMKRSRYDAVALAMANGNVLVVGGQTLQMHHRDAELFDPNTATFTRFTGQSDERAFGHTATLLDDGRVLAVGGFDYAPNRTLASADLFDLALPTVDAGEVEDAGTDAADAADAFDARDAAEAAPSDAAVPSTPGETSGSVPSTVADAERRFDAGGSGCALAHRPAASHVLAVLFVLALVRRVRARDEDRA